MIESLINSPQFWLVSGLMFTGIIVAACKEMLSCSLFFAAAIGVVIFGC